jgi:hypothetical protein
MFTIKFYIGGCPPYSQIIAYKSPVINLHLSDYDSGGITITKINAH